MPVDLPHAFRQNRHVDSERDHDHDVVPLKRNQQRCLSFVSRRTHPIGFLALMRGESVETLNEIVDHFVRDWPDFVDRFPNQSISRERERNTSDCLPDVLEEVDQQKIGDNIHMEGLQSLVRHSFD